MSLQYNPQPVSPQSSSNISVHPCGGTPPISSPSDMRPQPSHNQHNHSLCDAQYPLFTHPMPTAQQSSPINQSWMHGHAMGTGSMLLMEERSLNPDLSVSPLYPGTIHDYYHLAGASLAINMMGNRRVSPSAERSTVPFPS